MNGGIKECRICGNKELISIISLGNLYLTGVFPKERDHKLDSIPLELVKCNEDNDGCGLLQLKYTPNLINMYGETYGYRSGLNKSMVNHLKDKVEKILSKIKLDKNDLVVDIGSNDGTMLGFYPENVKRVGIDPTGSKFKKYYKNGIELIPEFFSSKLVNRKAKIVTSIAMFYDLEKPLGFMKEIFDILDDNGIWVFEQSYMPKMLEVNAYDTICQEHLEYYRLKQIKWMCDKAGLKIINVEFNDVNGGSFSVMATKKNSKFNESKDVEKILKEEKDKGLSGLKPYQEFKKKVFKHREELLKMIKDINKNGSKIYGYGASTKGNVILQFCKLSEKDIPAIGEVNEDKFGAFTPGTRIPIISEEEVKEKAEYMMVLPWHFKKFIVEKEKEFLDRGGKLLFPLPEPHIVKSKDFKA